MIKRYSFEQLENFVKGYELSNKPLSSSNFSNAILLALCEIHRLVSQSDKVYENSWNRNAKQYHNWLSFDVKSQELVYDTGSRDEEWSNNLLDGIFEQYDYTSVKNFAELKKTKQFIDEFRVLSSYYASQGYFSHLFDKGIDNLTSQEWHRVSKNKYAIKVLDAFLAPPLFKVGEIVSPRANREITTEKYANVPKGFYWDLDKLLVLSNTEPIINARKGAKRYKVAPMGGNNQPFWIEEAFLKSFKKKVNKK